MHNKYFNIVRQQYHFISLLEYHDRKKEKTLLIESNLLRIVSRKKKFRVLCQLMVRSHPRLKITIIKKTNWIHVNNNVLLDFVKIWIVWEVWLLVFSAGRYVGIISSFNCLYLQANGETLEIYFWKCTQKTTINIFFFFTLSNKTIKLAFQTYPSNPIISFENFNPSILHHCLASNSLKLYTASLNIELRLQKNKKKTSKLSVRRAVASKRKRKKTVGKSKLDCVIFDLFRGIKTFAVL